MASHNEEYKINKLMNGKFNIILLIFCEVEKHL